MFNDAQKIHKIVVSIVLVAVSGGAMAEWVEAMRTKDGITDYVETSSIRRGKISRMWVLTDFDIPQKVTGGRPYLSNRKQMEFNCADETFSSRGHTFFSENMGKGEIIFVMNESRPIAPIPPGSAIGILANFVCDKE